MLSERFAGRFAETGFARFNASFGSGSNPLVRNRYGITAPVL
jgi:hypothetical protein